jgi:hypothetical protein
LGGYVTSEGTFVGCALCPNELAGLDVQRDGEHLGDRVVLHHGHEEDEKGAVVDAGVGQEKAVDVCGTVGKRIAEGGETGMDVVPADVAEDGGIAVTLFPDVAFERLAPVTQCVARGGVGGAALEEGGQQEQRET